MTAKKLVQQAKVRTNTIKGSVCRIDAPSVKFSELWNAYPGGNPCDGKDKNGKPAFSDQCAIRVGVALTKVGVTFKSYPEKGKCWFKGHTDHVLRAKELAEWLKLQPFVGCTKPTDIKGRDWQERIKGKTGIIYFADYWRRKDRNGVEESHPTGDHIDLWNGSRLTTGSGEFLARLTTFGRFTLGFDSGIIYSDLGKATEILFWEIK
ncbi:type VI secretion system amidase effector protein Tae4 [uncultured Herbaspirillum sp.]|uniref:type VI secretion system amidase effector protein Tae4 n=1 Tax=uncultured Herbaspirillum sp. TaxID=160236 RepID=UPI0025868EDD|nr:type VI secretion system amidase effector protein Tae4 [uncultured Herbaspirillum sp.]